MTINEQADSFASLSRRALGDVLARDVVCKASCEANSDKTAGEIKLSRTSVWTSCKLRAVNCADESRVLGDKQTSDVAAVKSLLSSPSLHGSIVFLAFLSLFSLAGHLWELRALGVQQPKRATTKCKFRAQEPNLKANAQHELRPPLGLLVRGSKCRISQLV